MNAKSCLTLVALLGPLALPAGAFAQAPAATAVPAAPAPRAGTPGGLQQRIDELRVALQITPAEQTGWDRFVQVMRDNEATMHEAFQQRGAKLATMSAVQNMQSYADLASLHAKDMQTLAATFQTLYAAMTPAQQQNADAVFRAWYAHPVHRPETGPSH
ncbi:MAG: Spy/CpxP family protein refolding chaperone [Acetobacteraceae bacterium]